MGGDEPSDGDSASDGDPGGYRIGSTLLRAAPPEPGLYLVATPIGNLSDITLRTLQVIAGADLLACEDTRVTGKLLSRFGIKRRMFAYHEHNASEAGEALLAKLQRGGSVALVSDAGTPLISDPGYRLVEQAILNDIPIIPIPGASAPLAALLASGLPSDSFFFAGFLPTREQARRRRLEELSRVPGTLIFFEAPHRIGASLGAMAEVLSSRQAAVCRELTKMHETIYRGLLPELAARFSAMDQIRGEIVVCVAPPSAEAAAGQDEADGILRGLLKELKPAQAAQAAARLTGLARRDLYRRALAMKHSA